LNYLEGFNRYKPQLLTGYAHSYYSLANLLIEKNRCLDYAPRALVLCAEKLTKAMKDVIYQVFHARAYEEYGSVENCALATECKYGSLHVNPDFGIVEIVDEKNMPVAAGETGRIVCTGLLNQSQPLIRYEVGDLGSWSTNRCPCQRDQMPVLQEVVGRIEDVVYGLNGQQMSRFHAVFLDLPAIREAQVIQETLNVIRVKVVVRGRLSAEDQSIICQRLRHQLGAVQIEVDRVDSLERTKRGKVKTVISHLTAAQGLAFGRAATARTDRGDLQ